MILSLTLLLAIAYQVESAVISDNILADYISTGFGLHKIYATQVTWDEARNICLDEGGQLSIIESAGEEAMLVGFMKLNNIRSAWIGIHELYKKNHWTTVMGERLDTLEYMHWAKGEPNNEGGIEDCGELHLGGFNNLPCDTKNAFICEKCPLDVSE